MFCNIACIYRYARASTLLCEIVLLYCKDRRGALMHMKIRRSSARGATGSPVVCVYGWLYIYICLCVFLLITRYIYMYTNWLDHENCTEKSNILIEPIYELGAVIEESRYICVSCTPSFAVRANFCNSTRINLSSLASRGVRWDRCLCVRDVYIDIMRGVAIGYIYINTASLRMLQSHTPLKQTQLKLEWGSSDKGVFMRLKRNIVYINIFCAPLCKKSGRDNVYMYMYIWLC